MEIPVTPVVGGFVINDKLYPNVLVFNWDEQDAQQPIHRVKNKFSIKVFPDEKRFELNGKKYNCLHFLSASPRFHTPRDDIIIKRTYTKAALQQKPPNSTILKLQKLCKAIQKKK